MLPYHKYKNILISFWHKPNKPNKVEGELRIKNGKVNPKYLKKIVLGTDFKPDGFWFSCGPSWYNYNLDYLETQPRKSIEVYKVLIREERLIKLNTLVRIEKIMKEYGENVLYGKNYNFYQINWKRVSQKYDGFIACPYLKKDILKKYRNQGFEKIIWYLMLDCSSGFIWNINGIKKCSRIGIFQDENNIEEDFRNMLYTC